MTDTNPRYLTSAGVATALGMGLTVFYRRRDDLRGLGFPEPVPWNTRLWLRQAVLDWIDTVGCGGQPMTPPPQPRDGNVVVHPMARQAAARRIVQRAARRSE